MEDRAAHAIKKVRIHRIVVPRITRTDAERGEVGEGKVMGVGALALGSLGRERKGIRSFERSS